MTIGVLYSSVSESVEYGVSFITTVFGVLFDYKVGNRLLKTEGFDLLFVLVVSTG